MSIPLIDLKAQYKSIKDEVLAAINSVLDSGEYILGRNVAALESAVADLSVMAWMASSRRPSM